MQRFFVPVVLVALALLHPAAAIAPAQVHDDPDELLRQVESRRQLAVRDMAQLGLPVNRDSRIERQLQQILASLDNALQSQILHAQFNAHYRQVEQALAKVELPADTARWEVVLAQLKAGARQPHDLEHLSSEFVGRAMSGIAPLQEQLAAVVENDVQTVLHHQFIRAQEELRHPYQQIVARSFPVWNGINLPPTPLPEPISASDADASIPMVGGMAGVALLVLHRIMRRMTRRITTRMAGKIAGKFIPFVGVVLIGLDLWDYAAAKTEMEKQFRDTFIAEYKSHFTPAAMWTSPDESGKSMRDTIAANYRELLRRWDEHCDSEARRVLDAARVYSISPSVQDYLREQQARSRHTDEVLEDLRLVWDTFEEHSADAPITELLDMIATAPDRDELRTLVRGAGTPLIHAYRQHGRDLLRAARTIGGDTLAAMHRSGADWRSAARQIERYGNTLSPLGRTGLLIALDAQAHLDTPLPDALLQNIARNEQLFRHLAAAGHHERLFKLFASQQVLEIVARGHEIDPQITLALHREWDPIVWQRYRRSGSSLDLQHLYDVASYRRDQRRQSHDTFAAETARGDELTPIKSNYGIEGLRLWDAHVTHGAGEHQRRQGERALGLYRRGYPADALHTPAALDLASAFDHVPMLGLVLYSTLAPLGWAAIVSIWIAVAILVILPVLFIWRVLRRWRQADRLYAERIRTRMIESRQIDPATPILSTPAPPYLPPPTSGSGAR
jgi:hypothetical protein